MNLLCFIFFLTGVFFAGYSHLIVICLVLNGECCGVCAYNWKVWVTKNVYLSEYYKKYAFFKKVLCFFFFYMKIIDTFDVIEICHWLTQNINHIFFLQGNHGGVWFAGSVLRICCKSGGFIVCFPEFPVCGCLVAPLMGRQAFHVISSEYLKLYTIWNLREKLMLPCLCFGHSF